MALTISGPVLHGISLVSGGNANLPDTYITPIGYGVTDTITLSPHVEQEKSRESLGALIPLPNGGFYDPFQTYDAPKLEGGAETWDYRFIGSPAAGNAYNFGHDLMIELESDYLGKRVYLFYLWFSGGSNFTTFPLWRATARFTRISYQETQGYGHRITTGTMTYHRIPGTYSNIGSVNSPSP